MLKPIAYLVDLRIPFIKSKYDQFYRSQCIERCCRQLKDNLNLLELMSQFEKGNILAAATFLLAQSRSTMILDIGLHGLIYLDTCIIFPRQ